MPNYRVIFQDSGHDSRRSDTTYMRVRVWEGDNYLGAWFGLLNGRSKRRYLADVEDAHHYESMAPVALALAIKETIIHGKLDEPRDVPMHPTTVLQLALEEHTWKQGDEVITFDA
jgi:hypothetical protein